MNNKAKAAGTGIRAAQKTSLCIFNYSPETLPLVIAKDVPLVDSRILAGQLGVKHSSTFRLILRYKEEFQEIDQLRFKIEVGKRIDGGGNAERYVLLTEDQSFFLLTLSRNSECVVRLKIRLVQAFRLARDSMEIAKDYLSGYHQLQDEVKHLAEVAHAAGSKTPEHIFYNNINRLVNNVCGLAPGQRAGLTPQKRMVVTCAGFIVKKAIESSLEAGANHRDAYASAKAQVEIFANGASLLLGA